MAGFFFEVNFTFQEFAQVLNVPFDEQTNAHTSVHTGPTKAENMTLESFPPPAQSTVVLITLHHRYVVPVLELFISGCWWGFICLLIFT